VVVSGGGGGGGVEASEKAYTHVILISKFI